MEGVIDKDVFNKLSYNNIPQTELNELKYRDVSNSSHFNENQKNILNDILDLYNKSNDIEIMLKESKDILEYETNYNNFKVKRLESELENIDMKYEAILNSSEFKKINIYPSNILTDSDIYSDNTYNCITVAPVSYETKTYIINDLDGSTFVPTNIYNKISYLNIYKDADIISNVSNNVLNAFDGNNSTYWINSITTDFSIKSIVASIEFEIPDNVITSREVNELLIRPYPANSVDILNIEYKTVTGSYQQIPNYQDYCMNQTKFNIAWSPEREEYEILDVDSLKLNFNNIPIHKIKVTIRQKYYIANKDNTNTFVWGFKTIEPRCNLYSRNYNKANFIIEFPINKSIIFDSIKPIYTNDTQIDEKKIKFNFYNLYSDGTKSKILNASPFACASSKLYVECYIQATDCSPNIIKFEAKYKYLE